MEILDSDLALFSKFLHFMQIAGLVKQPSPKVMSNSCTITKNGAQQQKQKQKTFQKKPSPNPINNKGWTEVNYNKNNKKHKEHPIHITNNKNNKNDSNKETTRFINFNKKNGKGNNGNVRNNDKIKTNNTNKKTGQPSNIFPEREWKAIREMQTYVFKTLQLEAHKHNWSNKNKKFKYETAFENIAKTLKPPNINEDFNKKIATVIEKLNRDIHEIFDDHIQKNIIDNSKQLPLPNFRISEKGWNKIISGTLSTIKFRKIKNIGEDKVTSLVNKLRNSSDTHQDAIELLPDDDVVDTQIPGTSGISRIQHNTDTTSRKRGRSQSPSVNKRTKNTDTTVTKPIKPTFIKCLAIPDINDLVNDSETNLLADIDMLEPFKFYLTKKQVMVSLIPESDELPNENIRSRLATLWNQSLEQATENIRNGLKEASSRCDRIRRANDFCDCQRRITSVYSLN